MTSSAPRIGVLGGGQLGRMMALAAARLGCRCGFLDPSPDASAGHVGPLTVASWDDAAAVRAWARGFDVVTYEFENVPADSLAAAAEVVLVAPSPAVLAVSGDRASEKRIFETIGLAVPPYVTVQDADEVAQGLATTGLPAMLKARRGGYDGKGQATVRTPADAAPGLAAIGRPCLLETRVPFDAEMSIAVVRGRDGRCIAWPAARNLHEDGILAVTRAGAAAEHPAISEAAVAEATEGVRALAEHLDYVGVLTVEFFVAGGRLLANEMAARVHNSMHWTQDGSATSQFENHVRAVAGLPLGDTAAASAPGMVNLIGVVPPVEAVPADARHRLHLYGKTAAPGRKIGHVNLLGADPAELETLIESVRASVPGARPAEAGCS